MAGIREIANDPAGYNEWGLSIGECGARQLGSRREDALAVLVLEDAIAAVGGNV